MIKFRLATIMIGLLAIIIFATIIAVRKHKGKDSTTALNVALVMSIVVFLFGIFLFFI